MPTLISTNIFISILAFLLLILYFYPYIHCLRGFVSAYGLSWNLWVAITEFLLSPGLSCEWIPYDMIPRRLAKDLRSWIVVNGYVR